MIYKSMFFLILLSVTPTIQAMNLGVHPEAHVKETVIKKHIINRSSQVCLKKNDQTNFAINAIRNEMMISALQCNWRDQYNSKVVGWKGWKSNNLDYWFRIHGGERAHLNYTTELSNKQSINDIHLFGQDYCQYHKNIFSYEVGQDAIKFLIDNDIEAGYPLKPC